MRPRAERRAKLSKQLGTSRCRTSKLSKQLGASKLSKQLGDAVARAEEGYEFPRFYKDQDGKLLKGYPNGSGRDLDAIARLYDTSVGAQRAADDVEVSSPSELADKKLMLTESTARLREALSIHVRGYVNNEQRASYLVDDQRVHELNMVKLRNEVRPVLQLVAKHLNLDPDVNSDTLRSTIASGTAGLQATAARDTDEPTVEQLMTNFDTDDERAEIITRFQKRQLVTPLTASEKQQLARAEGSATPGAADLSDDQLTRLRLRQHVESDTGNMIVAPEDLDLAARIRDSATLYGLGADPEHLGVTADDRARHDKTYNGLATPDDVRSFLANVVRQIDAGPRKPSPVTDVTREKCVRQWREGRSEAAWSRHVCAVCEGAHRRREMDTISDAYDADLVPWGVQAIEKKLEGTDALELLRVRVDKFFTRHRMNFAGYALNPVALFQPDKERADAWASDRKGELCSEEEKLAAFKSLKFGMCKCCASAIKRKKLPPTASRERLRPASTSEPLSGCVRYATLRRVPMPSLCPWRRYSGGGSGDVPRKRTRERGGMHGMVRVVERVRPVFV